MFLIHSGVLVIGGSAAGLAAAITSRRQYPNRKVALLREESRVPIPTGIPYVFGTLSSPEKNLFSDSLLTDHDIRVFDGKAVRIDREGKMIELENGDSIGYERLVLATGSRPAMVPIPGFDLKNVFTIEKNLKKLQALKARLADVKRLAIIGGGFIGVEIAQECRKGGVEDVTIVEQRDRCLSICFDEEFCVAAEEQLTERGISLKTGLVAKELQGRDAVEQVVLSNGYQLPVDAVIMAVGAVPNADLAKASNISLGATGGIAVDRSMKTSDPAIFAAGDCSEKPSFFGGTPCPFKLASIACAEARIAGANLFGLRREYPGTIGAWGTVVGELGMACAGLSVSRARERGYDVVSGTAASRDRHPDEMPGGVSTTIKLVFERRTGVLLGAQIMGGGAVMDKVNLFSSCIQHRMTFDDIATFQFGTHPALTGAPLYYQTVVAAEEARGAQRLAAQED